MSRRFFDPSGFDYDIFVIEVKGRGRGRGVEVVGRYSILDTDDEEVILIKNRLLVLLKLLEENGTVSKEEIVDYIGLETEEDETESDYEEEPIDDAYDKYLDREIEKDRLEQQLDKYRRKRKEDLRRSKARVEKLERELRDG